MRQRTVIIAAAILVPALILFWSVLFGGRLFSGLYVNLYHYFFLAAQKHLVFDLHLFPNWWPSFYSGYPISLTLDGFLNPIFLVALWILPVIDAYHWLTLAFFLINILSCYALARALKLTPAASLLAAVAYGFSGIIIRWTDVIVFTALFPLLPLIFLSCLNIQEGKRGWRWILLFLLAYGWIGGFAELVVYDLIATVGWCFYLLFRDQSSETVWKKLCDGIKKFLLPVLLSVVLVSPWLISVLVFITKSSSRAGGLALDQASSMPIGLSHLIRLVLPRLTVTYGENLPFLHLGDDIDLYIGTVALLLLLTIPFIYKTLRRGWGFFLGLLSFAILMAFRSPLYLVLRHLPVINWFRWHFKWLFLATFAAALLAGYAFDAISTFNRHRFARKFVISLWIFFGVLVTVSVAITLAGPQIISSLVNYGQAHYAALATASGRALPLTADYYGWIINLMANSLIHGLSFTNPLMFWTIFCWAIALIVFSLLLHPSLSLSRKRQLLVAAAILSTTVWSGFLTGFSRNYLTEQPATSQFIAKQEQKNGVPFRTYDYFPDQSVSRLQDRYRLDFTDHDNRALLTREMLSENIQTYFGFDAAVDHEPLSVARIADLQNLAFGRDATSSMLTLEGQLEHFSTTSTATLLGKMNVKYVTSPHSLTGPWKLIYIGHILNGQVAVMVFENPFFQPRWSFAEQVSWADDLESATAAMKSNDAKTTVLEGADQGDGPSPVVDPQDKLEILNYSPGKLEFKTHTSSTRWIVFRETYVAPFWHASVDGQNVQIVRADLGYQAVKVAAGDHSVRFYFDGFWEQARQSLKHFFDR